MSNYLLIAQVLVSIALILVVLMQTRGGGLGGIFGQPTSVYQTRRGLEKTLFQITIVLVVLFLIIAVLLVRTPGA